MLAAPPRTESGHRIYGWAHKQTLAFIRRGRELGFTLQEIRVLLDLGGPTNAPCADVREVAATHLKDIRTKIADLRKLERLLASTIDRCDSGTSPACPVLEILGSGP